MSKRRISLIVDHPLRDLPGVSLIAKFLAENNFDVYLVPMYVQERECLALAPDFVLLNYLRKNNESFAHRLMLSRIQFGVNDTEGGFYGDLSFYGKVISHDSELYQYMNCNLLWGEKIRSYLQNEFSVKHNMIITGLPRFDFYSESLRDLKINLVPEPLKKNLLLVNTKVAIVNPQFQSLKKEIDLYRNKLGISEELIQHCLTYGKFSIEDNIALCKALSRQLSESNVVLRPHPHENAETYSRHFDKRTFPNVSVYREGPVAPWILASKAVIHRHCTTAIEAALCGKPALSPTWVRFSADAPDSELVSHHASSMEELTDLIKAAIKDELKPTPEIERHLSRVIEDWLFAVDGKAHQRVAAAIAGSLKSNVRTDVDRSRKQIYQIFNNRKDFTGKLYSAFNQLSENSPSALWQVEKLRLKKWKTSTKFFTPQQVSDWITPVQQAEGKPALTISWAPCEDYLDSYPGVAVKVTRQTTPKGNL